jgi:pimeloyl-ACP methyl ester carboxylesterase
MEEIKESGGFKYVDRGEGEVIILLHGLFGAMSNFRSVTDHFSKKYRVIIPLMPLYEMPVLKTSIKNLATFIEKFVKHMGFEKVSFLGNSLGGHVGLVYSLKNPDKVQTLILTGSSGLYENAFGGSFPRRHDREYLRQKIALTFYNPEVVTDELVEDCLRLLSDRNILIRILALSKSAIRHNVGNDLHKLKMPVCLIWGRNDTITPPHVAEEFKQKVASSDLFWIDECGHAPMMEHPETFNEILDAWIIKKVPPRG